MSAIWKLLKSDMKHLFANVVSTIIAIGLIVVPSLFAWFNTIACWDVFNNTGNLTVAVANSDEGYTSDLFPLRVNIGDQVVSALRANDDINWTFTDEQDAVDGAAAGRYYAAVVIPKNFSQDMLSFYADGAEHSEIRYYSNEKKSAIAPKITDQGADSIAYTINETFAETLAEISLSLAASLDNYLDSADAQSALATLVERMDSSAGEMQRAANAFTLYAAMARDMQSLLEDTAALADTAQGHFVDAQTATSQVDGEIAEAASGLSAYADELSEQLKRASERLNAAQNDAESLLALLPEDKRTEIEELIASTQDSLTKTQASLDGEVRPTLSDLSGKATHMNADVQNVLEKIDSAQKNLATFSRQAAQSCASAADEVDAACARLSASAGQLRDLSEQLGVALQSNDVDTIRKLLSSDTQALAQALSAPVATQRIALYPVDNFGSAMAPLYSTLALFIGSLLILVAVKPTVSKRALRDLGKARPAQIFIGRFGVIAFLSLCQSTLMALGNMLFLQVQVAHPMLFLLCFWVSGLVFAFLIYALVSVFANLGKAAAVLLLIVQVTGCGGSFPLQILPAFIQKMSPWLPATHTVDAMRAAMMGITQGDFWTHLGLLVLFIVPAATMALLLRKPLGKFMQGYLARVEKSKLM